MAFERQTGIHLTHPDTIIYHLQQRASGIANDHLYTGSTRIQAVLHQLFQTRSGALYHLACCYLVSHTIR